MVIKGDLDKYSFRRTAVVMAWLGVVSGKNGRREIHFKKFKMLWSSEKEVVVKRMRIEVEKGPPSFMMGETMDC